MLSSGQRRESKFNTLQQRSRYEAWKWRVYNEVNVVILWMAHQNYIHVGSHAIAARYVGIHLGGRGGAVWELRACVEYYKLLDDSAHLCCHCARPGGCPYRRRYQVYRTIPYPVPTIPCNITHPPPLHPAGCACFSRSLRAVVLAMERLTCSVTSSPNRPRDVVIVEVGPVRGPPPPLGRHLLDPSCDRVAFQRACELLGTTANWLVGCWPGTRIMAAL